MQRGGTIMRRLFTFGSLLATATILLASAGPASAAMVPFTGTLSIQDPAGQTWLTIPGSGTATVNGSLGGHPITQLTIPGGVFSTAGFATVFGPLPTFGTVLATPVPIFATVVNRTITLASGGSCTQFHPNVSCPGGGLAGFGGLSGAVFVPLANLSIPLTVIGSGSNVFAGNTSVGLALSGAGWTTGTVLAFGSTSLGGTVTSMGVGSRSTDPGSNFVTDRITLVSPISLGVLNPLGQATVPGIATLSLHIVPEPGALLMILSGVLGFAAYERYRSRR
jgi:hypothetical protein